MARAARLALEEQPSSAAAVRFLWEALWTQERRRQARTRGGRAALCPLGRRPAAAAKNAGWNGPSPVEAGQASVGHRARATPVERCASLRV